MEFQFDNSSPVYLQIASQIEAFILSGSLQKGDRLPSVRELALTTKTNPNTVSKALAELERKGLIETRRTSGKFVCASLQAMETLRGHQARQLCRQFLASMKALGCSKEVILRMLESEEENNESSD